VKYADDLVLLAKEENGVIDRLIDFGRRYGMEMNVEKNWGNEDLKAAIPQEEVGQIKNNWRLWNISVTWVAW
jgi:hypothetical protein